MKTIVGTVTMAAAFGLVGVASGVGAAAFWVVFQLLT